MKSLASALIFTFTLTVSAWPQSASTAKGAGDTAAAQKLIESVIIALDGQEQYFHVALAIVCLQHERWDGVDAHALDALNVAPGMADGRALRGLADLKRGGDQAALAELSDAIERQIAYPLLAQLASFYRSDLLYMAGRFDEAIVDLDHEAGGKPLNAALLNERAWYHLAQGDYQGALDDAEASLAASWSPSVLDTRAWAFYHLGMHDKALADAQRVVQEDPSCASSRALLFRLEADTAVVDQARSHLRAGLKGLSEAARGESMYLLLRYLAGEVPIDALRGDRRWQDFRMALHGMPGVE